MVQKDREVRNAARREFLHQQDKKAKAKAKLNRRLEIKKAEKEDASGELRRQRLETNIPRTIEGTREWVGEAVDAAKRLGKGKRVRSDQDSDDDEEGFFGDEEDQEPKDGDEKDTGDARLRPVQVKSGTENSEELVLDMAGLEDLFPEDDQPEASTSAIPPHKPILLTTSPRPHGPTYAFLNELQSLLGGKQFAQIVPRKNKRFELSKVVKWASKRGYGAIIVVGEDFHGEPATLTMSLLPHGPCAHFRLTSIQLHKQISNSANPTAHAPELVLSNFSTPLGLSIGRLVQSVFPPLPQIVGRQVVAIHNQRDFIFVRRFRYMFALRETEASRAAAKTQGRDEDLRTKMQEIGPRFTLKLRWLKRGSLGEGRKRGAVGVTGEKQSSNDDLDEDMNVNGEEEDVTQQDKEDEAAARQEMFAELGEKDKYAGQGAEPASTSVDQAQPIEAKEQVKASVPAKKENKSKRFRTHSPTTGRIMIPTFEPTRELPKSELPHHRKLKKNASILDSLAVQVAYGRGGMKKDKKEFEWNPRMNVSRRKFML